MSATSSLDQDVEVETLTPEQGRALFEGASRRLLGVSGEEFLTAWHNGEYENDPRAAVYELTLLVPFAE
ncbi:MAG: hypothetical protein ACTHQ3_12800 [Motilibacteraceae bacterium]